MGIKGIYGEIGPGERVALSKLSIEKFEQTGRPLRIAIDVSIWQFQTQAGQGGSNPAIRTFYYRLLRLISTSIQPLFIFDGPHKPPFKRNKRTDQHGTMVPNLLTKQLLKLFGFPFYMAPGEAEAECALLQREGVVDAVFSEDVDTLMFGCGRTLRNWSSEGSRGNKSPTHVSVYDAKATKEGKAALDREGMILIALMSGGDYITEGIPGCGIKVACEAARAGYGKSLCKISRSDADGLEAWRDNLAHEIKTNESKHFRVKHKTLRIPDDFPNKEVLGYYTHPVVSSASKIQKLKQEIVWDGEVDIPGLRLFVAEAFDWIHKNGAKKFIRGLAPAILVQKLRSRSGRRDSEYGDVVLTAMNEMELVRVICDKRNHFSTDGISELRVIYHPAEIVGLDLDAEEDDSGNYGRDGLAPVNDDDQIEEYVSEDAASRSRSTSPTKRAASAYDPTQPDKTWIPESIAKVGIPLKVEDYEESLRDPRKFIKAKAAAKKAATKTKDGMPKGAMDRFVKVTKSVDESGSGTHAAPTKSTATKSTRSKKAIVQKPAPNTNPWTIAASSPQSNPRVHKPISQQPKASSPLQFKRTAIYIDSSPPVPASSAPPGLESPSSPRKHQHSPTLPLDYDSEPELPPTIRLTRGSYNSTKEFGTPTKNSKDIDRPSPKKKISPDLSERRGSAGRRSISEPPGPESVAQKLDFTDLGSHIHEEGIESWQSPRTSVSQKAEDHFQFELASCDKSAAGLLDLPRAKDWLPTLPNTSDLVPARAKEAEVIDLASSPASRAVPAIETGERGEMASPPKPMPRPKKYTMVRESTDGTFWEGVDEEKFQRRSNVHRYSQVEVLDLTSDD
ncbi:hypothetical protein BGZ57DRAFT_1017914 [Hyaloscypha finlandica]|nr:hypothetical protein BGZ57DRAFT_1017914 [Hyaloscypha finlandica]